MNAKLLHKVTELDGTLIECMMPWHGIHGLEIKTRLELVVEDNSSDTAEAYRPGGIAQVTKPVMYLEYWCSQFENDSLLIEMDCTPTMQIELDANVIDFHIAALKNKYLSNPPGLADWDVAEKSYKESLEKYEDNLAF